MGHGERTSGERGSGRRAVVYCLIPPELAERLHDLLRDHFRDDPGVEVVVERRGRERRSGSERRGGAGEPPPGGDRRRVRSATGRRVGERRTAVTAAEPPPLPRRARRYAEQIAFVARLEPSTQRAEDLDTARLVTRFQAGDREAFAPLYRRYFERLYGYLRVALRDRDEAEDATHEVFLTALETLDSFEHREKALRYWLFVVARNEAIGRLRRQHRLEVVDPAELDRRRAETESTDEQLDVLGWISDRDLALFVERLPLPQRQVLVLRYTLDLSASEIAEVLDREPADVRVLQHRALRFLEDRLSAIGRGPKQEPRARMRQVPRQAGVLRLRRFALWR